jgi:hypothetical protein
MLFNEFDHVHKFYVGIEADSIQQKTMGEVSHFRMGVSATDY